jgi:hypothetical protein
MPDVIVGGDLKLSAKNLRDEAERLDAIGGGVGAKRCREAAWHLEEAGDWLGGERDAGEALSPSPAALKEAPDHAA